MANTGPLVFTDIETTGLRKGVDQVWEFAAIRVDPEEGTIRTWEFFVEHNQYLAEDLPEAFRKDHDERYDPNVAYPRGLAAHTIVNIFAGADRMKRAHMVGCNPAFDAAMLWPLLSWYGPLAEAPWHYHLIDVEAMTVGYAIAKGLIVDYPWNSNELSNLVGVVPPLRKHEAMEDAVWAQRWYNGLVGR